MRQVLFGALVILLLVGITGGAYYIYTESQSVSGTDENTISSSIKTLGESCNTNSQCSTNLCTQGVCTTPTDLSVSDTITPPADISTDNQSNTSSTCAEIKRFGSSNVSKGEVVVYKYVHISDSSTNPLPNAGLVVSSGIGRDFYAKNSTTVSPSPIENNPSRDTTKGTWTYYFTWEAENPTANQVKAIESSNSVEGVIYTNKNQTNTSVRAIDCLAATDTSVADDLQVGLVLNKFVNEVCNSDGTTQYVFDIRVTNIGSETTEIDSIVSDYDVQNRIASPSITTITKNGTSTSTGVNWSSVSSIGVGETQKFSYILNISPTELTTLRNGFSTSTVLDYGDNSAEFEKVITPICTGRVTAGEIPVTGIFSSTVNYLFMGIFLLLVGLFSVKYLNIHPRLQFIAQKFGIDLEYSKFESNILKEHERKK